MPFAQDLKAEVQSFFRDQWSESKTEDVPAPEDVQLGNHAKHLSWATVLYADLSGSTRMVDDLPWFTSAEIYKAYLRCTARIIRDDEGGDITAYDGDRIMAVFVGPSRNTRAARCALKINYAVTDIIQPAFKSVYSSSSHVIQHVVGVDTSPIRAVRVGVRGDNDLVWVGTAANYAAKLTEERVGHATWITKAVYDGMRDEARMSDTGENMWRPHTWLAEGGRQIYGSTWRWKLT